MTTVFNETFNDAAGFTLSAGASLFSDGSGDFLGLTDGATEFNGGTRPTAIKTYTGFDGRFLTGMDLDGDGGPAVVTLTWSGIDISGLTDLGFSGLFGEVFDSPGDIDNTDFIQVSAQIDGGGFLPILAFAGADFTSSGTFNGVFRHDTDLDGTGDGDALTGALAQFTASIAGTGTTLDLQLDVRVEAGDEDFAVDSFAVTGTPAAPVFTINEVDADTPGTDAAEFVEIFDGGLGLSPLDGLVVVFFNGSSDTSYAAFDLDGFSTNADGYFVLGNSGVANVGLTFAGNLLQNGADAVALYTGDATDFPNGTAAAATNLLDAVVYDTADADDAGLLAALGQATQHDEAGGGDKDTHSNSRLPDGGASFVQQAPTPGASNTPAPSFTVADASVTEGGTLSFEITRAGDTSGTQTVLVEFAHGTTAAADLTSPLPASVTVDFLPGETVKSVEIATAQDSDVEADETLGVSIGLNGSGVVSDTATGTILDNDAPTFTKFVESFETAPGTSYTLSAEFDDGGFDYFGRYAAPDVANSGRNPFSGFDGSFAIFGQDHDGDGNAATQTISIDGIDIAGLSDGVVSASFGALNSEPTFFNFEAGDQIDIFATIDGGARILIGAFAPTFNGTTAGDLALDTDFDGTGDGLALTTTLTDFSFLLPGTGITLDLDIEITSTDSFENWAIDKVCVDSLAGLSGNIEINELRIGRSGADADFIELFSPDVASGAVPELDLDGLTLLVLSGEFAPGQIDFAFDLTGGSFDADDGFFLLSNPGDFTIDAGDLTASFDLIGSPSTVMLVSDFTGAAGDDLDTDDDGVLDVTPFGTVIDAVSLVDGDATPDRSYASDVVGPDGSFTPGGAKADPDGSDSFQQLAFGDTALDTPGETNAAISAGTVFIHEIQGVTDFTGITATVGVDDLSPLNGATVTIQGIVTRDFQSGLNGFFVQEEDADADANPFTSEGIFVFDPTTLVDVNEGDLVTVTGTVSEFFGLTEITASFINVDATGQTLPTATVVDLPSAGVMVAGTSGGLNDYVVDLEAVEGMLVQIADDLTLTEMFNLDRFNEVRVSEGGRLENFTQVSAPDVTGFDAHRAANAARSIVLDDGRSAQNQNPIEIVDGNDGVLSNADQFRMGDVLGGLTGVVNYSFNEFRLNDPDGTYTQGNPRPAAPDAVGGDFKVASLNVLNFFTTIDTGGAVTDTGLEPRGADSAAEFDRQLEKLVNAIVTMDADVLGLLEIENSATDAAVSALVDAVNAVVGAGTYDFVATGLNGTDAITNALIYKTTTTEQTAGTTTATLDDSQLAGLGVDPGVAVFDGDGTNRNPVAASFTHLSSGEKLTIAVNHFKSKGSAGPAPGDADALDGQAFSNATRLNAAVAVDAWLATDPTGSGDPDVLLLGDLNAYANEDPVTFLEGRGFTDLAEAFIGSGAYSFVFDGEIGTLDYAMANASLLAQVTGATEWHINADEPDALDYNLDFSRDPALFDGTDPNRHSDHDPVIVGLTLGGAGTGNTAPVFDNFDAFISVDTGAANQKLVRNFDATDAEGDALVWSLEGADAGVLRISPTTGALYFAQGFDGAPASADGDFVYDVDVIVFDGTDETRGTLQVEIPGKTAATGPVAFTNLPDTSVTPFVVDADAANQRLILNVDAEDGDGLPIGFAITGGADAFLFNISATTGALYTRSAPFSTLADDSDGNSIYEVEVTATASDGDFVTETFLFGFSNELMV